MGLEEIVSGILQKAQREAQALVEEAERAAAARREEVGRALDQQMRQTEQRARDEARALEARLAASAHLEARKQELAAKRSLVDQAVDLAFQRILQLDEERYVAFLVKLLSRAPMRGQVELVVSQRDRRLLEPRLDAIQAQLKRAGADLVLTLSGTPGVMDGGFILRQGKVEYNASLGAIRRAMEEELRRVAAASLFGQDA